LNEDFTPPVEEQEVHNTEVAVALQYFASPYHAGGVVMFVDRIDQHVLTDDHLMGAYHIAKALAIGKTNHTKCVLSELSITLWIPCATRFLSNISGLILHYEHGWGNGGFTQASKISTGLLRHFSVTSLRMLVGDVCKNHPSPEMLAGVPRLRIRLGTRRRSCLCGLVLGPETQGD